MALDIIREGYVKFQSKNIGVWKKRWLILRSQTKTGPVRLEKYKDECVAVMSGKCRTYILTDALNLDRVPDSEKRHAIHIDVDQYESIQFCLESEGEANTWMKKIEGEIAEAHISKNSFAVYFMKNSKSPIHGDCTLEFSEESVRILNHRDKELLAWPLNKLRRYAVEGNLFRIEAGRSCPSGEGEFVFETKEAQDIYDRIHALTKSVAFSNKMKNMKIMEENTSNDKKYEHKASKFQSAQYIDTKKHRSIQELSASKTFGGNKNDYRRIGRNPSNSENSRDNVKSPKCDTDEDGVYAEVPSNGRSK